MANTPNYASTPRAGSAAISTADTSRTAPTQFGTAMTGAATGTRVDRMVIAATGTTTPGMVRLFLHDGTNYRLLQEIPVAAAAPSATVQAFNVAVDFSGGIMLPNGSHSLRVTTHNAESFHVTAFGGDF